MSVFWRKTLYIWKDNLSSPFTFLICGYLAITGLLNGKWQLSASPKTAFDILLWLLPNRRLLTKSSLFRKFPRRKLLLSDNEFICRANRKQFANFKQHVSEKFIEAKKRTSLKTRICFTHFPPKVSRTAANFKAPFKFYRTCSSP